MENLTSNLANLLNLVKYPLITEKSVSLYADRQYTFIVDKSLTKKQIRYIIEKIFDVKVTKVRTLNLPLKTKKTVLNRGYGKVIGKYSKYKKAYIKLVEGNSINNIFS